MGDALFCHSRESGNPDIAGWALARQFKVAVIYWKWQ
jgi:hypothetical protein